MVNTDDVDYIRSGLVKMVREELSMGRLSPEGAELITRLAEADEVFEGDSLSVGEIRMPQHGGARLKRLVVFRKIQDGDTSYILYVPTEPTPPEKQIFHEKYDWRRLGYVIGGWLGKKNGLDYLIDLVDEDKRDVVVPYFHEISRRPSEWRSNALLFSGVPGKSYLHQIQSIINR